MESNILQWPRKVNSNGDKKLSLKTRHDITRTLTLTLIVTIYMNQIYVINVYHNAYINPIGNHHPSIWEKRIDKLSHQGLSKTSLLLTLILRFSQLLLRSRNIMCLIATTKTYNNTDRKQYSPMSKKSEFKGWQEIIFKHSPWHIPHLNRNPNRIHIHEPNICIQYLPHCLQQSYWIASSSHSEKGENKILH